MEIIEMKKLPENAKKFFSERAEKVIFPKDYSFIAKLENNDWLRNQVYPQLDPILLTWQNWERFLTLVIDSASLTQLENFIAAKKTKQEAENVLQEIIELSNQLVNKIDRLEELGELGFIHVPYADDVVSILLEAGKTAPRFSLYVEEPIRQATISKRDDRYLPSISNFIRTMAKNYEEGNIEFSRHYEDIMKTNRFSSRLFCVFLRDKIEESKKYGEVLSQDFSLSYQQIADFCNALFEEDITAENVKTYFAENKKAHRAE